MNSRTMLEIDQTLLNKLVLAEEPFRSRYPTVLRTSDTELSVSGSCYLKGRPF